VAVDAGAAPSTNYHWVVCNGGNTVAVRHADGTPVTTLAAGFGFGAPYDIVGSPVNHRVYVTNSVGGTVTVIDSDTLQLVQIVTITGSQNLRGMSLSEDESTVFIAGQDVVAGNNAAVFQLTAGGPPPLANSRSAASPRAASARRTASSSGRRTWGQRQRAGARVFQSSPAPG
jgi:YVTN family beta-propeller protein